MTVASAESALASWCVLSGERDLQGFAAISLTPAYPTSKRHANPEVGKEGG